MRMISRVSISIIMPVYNVENYVGKTIESVLNQRFTDFELFVIDDGSSDKSGQICEEYAGRDSRIKVIHQKNQGSSAARNAGLELAEGKYIYFIDADDWIEDYMLSQMISLAETNHSDLVVTGFKMEYYIKGKKVIYETPCPDKQYPSLDDFKYEAYQYFDNSLLSLPWNKLFLREKIEANHIRFIKTKWPDHHFCMDYLLDTHSVTFSSITAYHWLRSRDGNATSLAYEDVHLFEKRLEHFDHILRVYNAWDVDDETSMDGICSYFVGRVFQCVQEISVNKKLTKGERREKIREIVNHPTVIDALRRTKTLSLKMKILVIPLKMKWVWASMLFGKIVSWVRAAAPGIFIRLKEKTVHGA